MIRRMYRAVLAWLAYGPDGWDEGESLARDVDAEQGAYMWRNAEKRAAELRRHDGVGK